MEKEYITTKEAAKLTGKSESTIKRLIRGMNVKRSNMNVKQVKVQTGFKYLINKAFLIAHYDLKINEAVTNERLTVTNERLKKEQPPPKKIEVSPNFFRNVQSLLNQHKLLKQENEATLKTVQKLESDKTDLKADKQFLKAQIIILNNDKDDLKHQLEAANKKQIALPTNEAPVRQPPNFTTIFLAFFFALLVILIIGFGLFS